MLAAVWASSSSLAQTASLACNQKPGGRAHWAEYGYCDLPVNGPVRALGLILWSHGVYGDRDQYNAPLPPIVRALAVRGWDVVRINRNNLHERGWSTSGPRHRDDALERVKAARAQGYRHVILAGQSYGAAISLEANARSPAIDGVLALAPTHGSDAGQAEGREIHRNLERYLLEAASAQKGGRVVVLVPPDDLNQPGRAASAGARLKASLAATGRPHVVFDETLPIRGHLAGYASQFAAWFGDCVIGFLDPAQPVAAGETVCRPPNPLPRFLLPSDLQQPTPGTGGPGSWLGGWEGTITQHRAELLVVVEMATTDAATVVYATGAGPKQDLDMGYNRYTNARFVNRSLVIDLGRGSRFVMTLSADRRSVAYQYSGAGSETMTGTLVRSR